MKIKIYGYDHSVIVQKALFEIGYTWSGNDREPKYMKEPYLTTSMFGFIGAGIYAEQFDVIVLPEYILTDHIFVEK